MQRILIEAPEDDVVPLDEMKKHLRYEDDEQDEIVAGLTQSVIDTLDPAPGGGLGRALRPQTWELQLPGFPGWPNDALAQHGNEIELPYPPLIAIVSVKYDDEAGVEHTLTEGTDFEVIGMDGRGKQKVKPPYLGYWPLARCYPGSVRIRFQSGYPLPAEGDADTLPAAIKSYVKLMVSDLFENRQASQVASGSVLENPNLARLLDPYRVF